MKTKLRRAAGFVRWYNPERGFGHVRIAGGPEMALLRSDVLAKAGYVSAPDGAAIECDVAPGENCPVVTRVTALTPPADGRIREAPDGESPDAAVVSRFSAAKGAGAVKIGETGETIDVFTPTLRRCGLIGLRKGMAVEVVARRKEGAKRRHAVWIRPTDH